MSQPHRELDSLLQAHQELHRRLLEITRLSAQQCCVPSDRPDALRTLLDRKQEALRHIRELDAPALFADSARMVEGAAGDGPEVTQARARLRAEASANLDLWRQLVEAEEQARSHCAALVVKARERMAAGQRRDTLRRAYGAPGASAAPLPRFVDGLR